MSKPAARSGEFQRLGKTALPGAIDFCVRITAIMLAMIGAGSAEVRAATATATFNAQIIIQSSCQIQSPTKLDFGSQIDLSAGIDQTSTFQVQCSNGTTYTVGLNAGSTSGGTTMTRKMSSGAGTIDYQMFRDSARILNWGNAFGSDTLSGTGNGSAQTITVYGRVPIQAAPQPGTYSDTVTITVTF